jgi:hypothetical protein
MNLSKNIKPISYLKANAAQVALELKDSGEAMVITQNGVSSIRLSPEESWREGFLKQKARPRTVYGFIGYLYFIARINAIQHTVLTCSFIGSHHANSHRF